MQQISTRLKTTPRRSAKRLLTSVAVALLVLNTTAPANADDDNDDDDRGGGGRHERGQQKGNYQKANWIAPRADIAPVTNKIYQQECGSCHLAYQPGLLPANAWAEIMTPKALADHYGDDASLTESVRAEIINYLVANAADDAPQVRARAFAVPNESANAIAATVNPLNQSAPLPRISTTYYFQRKHDEIPARLVTGNPDVGSFSQCNKCHGGADKGIYNEHQVKIPNAGAWQD
ncbi:cytochrome C [Thiospirillum jenense]|uniref:Cytochrome C n=1 Tax=Thiospirillum jenense TaxID=1653858 RepID=A0A839HGC0_9GAMM|nr:cytochrome C [Thiospirillum jenense]MBB1126147.1 cytochrome C [Thiospirillum jenense]